MADLEHFGSQLWASVSAVPWPLVLLAVGAIFLLWLAREAMKGFIEAVLRRFAAGLLTLARGARSFRDRVLEGARDQAQTFTINRAEQRVNAHALAVDRYAKEDLERLAEVATDIQGQIGDKSKETLADLEASPKKKRSFITKTRLDYERLSRRMIKHQESLEDVKNRIDAFNESVERYEALLEDPKRKDLLKHGTFVATFLISILFIPLIAGGALLNFQLIARPMAEIVGSGLNVFGYPIYQVAALVMIALEAAAGIIFFDAIGVTSLFGIRERIEDKRVRRALAIGAGVLLLVLASLEAGLAVVREFILAGERAVETQLITGQDAPADADGALGSINVLSMIVQATLGFVIPFLLALIAIPLELFVETAPIMAGFLFAHLVLGPVQFLSLVGAVMLQILSRILLTLYDVVIFLPEKIRQAVSSLSGSRSRKNAPPPAQPVSAPGADAVKGGSS